jgi:hypothetical protein
MILDPIGQVDRVHAVHADQQDMLIRRADGRVRNFARAGGLTGEREERGSADGGGQK